MFKDIPITPGYHNYNGINPYRITYSITGNTLSIDTVEVNPEFRGKHLFSQLIDYFKSTVNVITLQCWDTLVPMYKHLGFIDEGVDEQGYHEMVWRDNKSYYTDRKGLITIEGKQYPIIDTYIDYNRIIITYYDETNKELKTLSTNNVNININISNPIKEITMIMKFN